MIEKRHRLLLVDDEPDVLEALSGCLAPHFIVETAASLADAQACVTAARPDVVLIDWRMPGGGGAEFLEWMESTGILVPTAVFSGDPEAPALVNITKRMGAGLLSKPLPSLGEAVACLLALIAAAH